MDTSLPQALLTLEARRTEGAIETGIAPGEIAERIHDGTVVLVKRAFDPDAMRRLRAKLAAWPQPPDTAARIGMTHSFRLRCDDPANGHVFDGCLFAFDDPQDAMAAEVRAPFDRLAEYWRALTGLTHDWTRSGDGYAIRPWAMCFPAGGGELGWHTHVLEPQRIGLVANLSEPGIDHGGGEAEIETPHGIVSLANRHGLGDLYLFRIDYRHRVTPVDPGGPRRWDGSGRWVLTIPVQADVPAR